MPSSPRRKGPHGVAGSVGVILLLVATMLATLLAPAGTASAPAAQETSSPRTRVKVLHADPTVEEFEVFIDGVEVLEDFAYGQASDWIDVAPGSARVTITADRAGFNVVVYDTVYPVPAGYDYSLIITEALVYGDVFDTSPVPEGSARVRVVHATFALPAVEVAAAGAAGSFATEIAYPQTSDYEIVPAGPYDFEVTLADLGDVVLTAPGVDLKEDRVYDLVLMGQPGDANHPLKLRPLSANTRE
jgi:hypothetical protein